MIGAVTNELYPDVDLRVGRELYVRGCRWWSHERGTKIHTRCPVLSLKDQASVDVDAAATDRGKPELGSTTLPRSPSGREFQRFPLRHGCGSIEEYHSAGEATL